MEITFSKVFTAEGEKNGKPWKRWDYKTADGQRFVSFKTGSIPLDVPVDLEIAGDNKIENWKTTGSFTPAENTQTTQESQNVSQAVRTAPTSPGRDFEAEARGKTRCALVAALLPALFTAQVSKGGEPSPENARVLLDWAFNYVFTPDDVPF